MHHTRYLLAKIALAIGVLSLMCSGVVRAQEVGDIDYEVDTVLPYPTIEPSLPIYPEATYDEKLPTPDACLGFKLGTRIASSGAIIDCFRTWAKQSPKLRVESYARSYEGRELVRVIIAAPERLKNIDSTLEKLKRLTHPQNMNAQEAEQLIKNTPALGWFGYSIHGDETSGADASLAFGYYLIAGLDERVQKILKDTVVVIDPVMNPDGRARFLGFVEQLRSRVPNLDYTSMHRGYWPFGRGNHYLFDLNRDWLTGSQPETRGRWACFSKFNPQLFVDVHEMRAMDTYLFSPKGQPVNPNYASSAKKWNRVFAADQGRAFDRYGWSYYTREWSDNWYPGYSSTWGPLQGAIGILHEQARYGGQLTRRRSKDVVTYRDAVHHHAVSSLTNALTLAKHREEILRDYFAYHGGGGKRIRFSPKGIKQRTFAIRRGQVEDREYKLVKILLDQGIEVREAKSSFKASDVQSVLGKRYKSLGFPQGTYLIDTNQAKGGLVRALLDFDPHFGQKALEDERKKLVRRGFGGIYDVTSWNLGMAFDLDTYWLDTPKVAGEVLSELDSATGRIEKAVSPAVAWAVSASKDAALAFAAQALELGIQVYAANTPFDAAGQRFPRGSFMIRQVENSRDISKKIERIAQRTGVRAFAIETGLSSTEGPDLGGHHFELLRRPRVGILTNRPAAPSDFGHLWYWIDHNLGLPVTLIDQHELSRYDLRRYNVLIVPHFQSQKNPLKAFASKLKTWVQAGGTLVAVGGGASMVADEALGLSKVKRRRDVLSELPLFAAGAQRWFESTDVHVNPSDIWEKQAIPSPSSLADSALRKTEEPRSDAAADRARAAEDAWLRRFSPSGAMVRGLSDDTHWLSYGIKDELPVLAQGDLVLYAPESARVVIRLAQPERLRLSGLLWPEARARIASTPWLTAEKIGFGQIILFAGRPGFRAQHLGTGRLLSNAVVLGPGLGAQLPLPW